MKTLKSRLVTLTVSMGMALAVMMVTPVLMGAFSQQDSAPVSYEACASSGSNCCKYDAYCGGPSGPKGYELYEGACSERDKKME